MTTIATENKRLSNWLKWELATEVAYCRKEVIVNEASAIAYVSGDVLGKVTATGKYKIAKQTASDGSQVPAAIVVYDSAIGAGVDKGVSVVIKGPAIVGKKGIRLDATYNDDTKKGVAYAALEAIGINVVEQVGV